jgi:hypothetical protein
MSNEFRNIPDIVFAPIVRATRSYRFRPPRRAHTSQYLLSETIVSRMVATNACVIRQHEVAVYQDFDHGPSREMRRQQRSFVFDSASDGNLSSVVVPPV